MRHRRNTCHINRQVEKNNKKRRQPRKQQVKSMPNKNCLRGIMANNITSGPRHHQNHDDRDKHIYSSGFCYDSSFGFFTGRIDLPQVDDAHDFFRKLTPPQKIQDGEINLKWKLKGEVVTFWTSIT
jgi:hypothetical protein